MAGSATIQVRLIGTELIVDPAAGFVLETNRDYVRACEMIRQLPATGAVLVILVRQQKHCWWLRRFLEQAGVTHTFTELGPREILAERWNVHLPEWLTPENISEDRKSVV